MAEEGLVMEMIKKAPIDRAAAAVAAAAAKVPPYAKPKIIAHIYFHIDTNV